MVISMLVLIHLMTKNLNNEYQNFKYLTVNVYI